MSQITDASTGLPILCQDCNQPATVASMGWFCTTHSPAKLCDDPEHRAMFARLRIATDHPDDLAYLLGLGMTWCERTDRFLAHSTMPNGDALKSAEITLRKAILRLSGPGRDTGAPTTGGG